MGFLLHDAGCAKGALLSGDFDRGSGVAGRAFGPTFGRRPWFMSCLRGGSSSVEESHVWES